MKRTLFLILMCSTLLVSYSQTNKVSAKIIHNNWDLLLKKHVDFTGSVNYKSFLNDAGKVSNYLVYLSQHAPREDWITSEKIAYYINLYNAATIHLILKNYPLNSIKDLENPWKKPFIKLGDSMVSLNSIEHEYLRNFNEPRIHFAINCASISCPKLLNEAFTAQNLEEQLEEATYQFINSEHNLITEEAVSLSKIFKWYKKDFTKTQKQSLQDYIKRYSTVIISPKATIQFMEYDWGLNDTSN